MRDIVMVFEAEGRVERELRTDLAVQRPGF